MAELDQTFWTERYLQQQTGWDIGYVSTPIKTYLDQVEDKALHVLIPGAGNAYEAEYAWQQGFQNVWVVDISEEPLKHLAQRVPDFPKEQLIHQDFFAHEGQYDLIIEQTFFCALDPKLREAYALKMKNLLKPKGRLVGLLFNAPMNEDRPPFGGHQSEYQALFEKYFQIHTMAEAHNSIPPRQGKELFIRLGL